MGVGVVTLLLRERLDLCEQLRVLDLVEKVKDRPHEEPLTMREQHVDAVRDRGRDGTAARPVAGTSVTSMPGSRGIGIAMPSSSRY